MNKKVVKITIICIIAILFIVFLALIYKNVFASSNDNRFSEVENYKLSKEEEKATKSVFTENEKVKTAKVYKNNKIINIMVTLNEDIDLDELKSLANDSLSKLSEENLAFYDVEIFVKSLNEESEIYPRIGYKFKENTEFAW